MSSLWKIRPTLWCYLLITLLGTLGFASADARTLDPENLPAQLVGVVTEALTNQPVVGAKITVNGAVTWSVANGAYALPVDPPGTYVVSAVKPGYVNFNSAPVVFQPGVQKTLNIVLWESLNVAGNLYGFLDTALQIIYLNWEAPRGSYELLYDDGIEDDFTVWAFQGNMHAVRYTAPAYPATVRGGMVHIGDSADYPAGSSPLVPFQVAVYDAQGSTGMPGSLIGGPFDVIPTRFGWNEFAFPSDVVIPAGDFYLVMIQGGNAPNAAGIALDQTATSLRSVTRFVTGGGPWIPANGNYLMRARMFGSGGPLAADSLEDGLIQYHLYRLRQGEEQNSSVWTPIGTTTELFFDDPSWFSLPCGPYRWAVKAEYANLRMAAPGFSNVLGKCWTVNLTVGVDLSCEAADPEGSSVMLKNLVYPDTMYSALVNNAGNVVFPAVWKGSYKMEVRKFGYQPYTQQLSLTSDTLLEVTVLQKKPPPRNLEVDDKTLIVQWDEPQYRDSLFQENWDGGSFGAQGWTFSGGYNWNISTTFGNPEPSAMFSWSPQVTNYNQSLISKVIPAVYAPVLELSYDILLDNFGTTTMNNMAVEVWDGTDWHLLHDYSNASGSIPWTTGQETISALSGDDIRVRFRAHGEDSYDINGWYVDNILVAASETQAGIANCILGYNVYLDNVLVGFTTDTKYLIPSQQVQYGQSYEVCALASYGSGYSPKTCTQFVSGFLYPPRSLAAESIENAVYLTWLKPKTADSMTPQGLTGYRIYRNDILWQSLDDPDSLEVYDFDLEPGIYHYAVTAWYDLAPYGYPGQYDESMEAGPVTVVVNYGRLLPFLEPWDQASFQYNDWQFDPTQGNWEVVTDQGHPPPCARFSWQPPVSGYSYGLISPVFDATAYSCSRIFLDFDLRLDDISASGTEALSVEVYYNNTWHLMTTYLNQGSYSWRSKHLDISPVTGKSFRIRFLAYGDQSTDISGWFIDNVHIYPIGYPAEDLQGDVMGFDVHLTWEPPGCSGTGGILDEGFEGAQFPPSGWSRIITNPEFTWSHIPASSPLGVHSGNYAAGVYWAYSHQDEWLIVRDILVTGNLSFWSRCYQGSVHHDHYYVELSPDGGQTWIELLDMSALPPYSSPSGYNDWETPYEIDLSAFTGQVVDIAWHAVDDDGQGLWYSWAIDDCLIATDALNVVTYDVFRKASGSNAFSKINANPVSDTTYLDPGLIPDEYAYFVRAISSECTQSEPSDTIVVDVITTDISPGDAIRKGLELWPNPASGELNILIKRELLNAGGNTLSPDSRVLVQVYDLYSHCVLQQQISGGFPLEGAPDKPHQSTTLDISHLPPGLYLLSVQTNVGMYQARFVVE